MTVRLDEKDHVVNVWFADDVDGNDLLVILRRRENQYLLDVRIRLRVDDRVYDSEDEKDFWRVTLKPGITEETALTVCKVFWVTASEKYCMHQICQRVGGGPKKFTRVMKKYAAFHSKEIPKETPVDSDGQERL